MTSKVDKERQEIIEEIKRNLNKHSEARARMWAFASTALITLAILVCVILIVTCFDVPIAILNLSIALSGLGGFYALWTRGRSKLRNIISKCIYRRKIKEAKLDQMD